MRGVVGIYLRHKVQIHLRHILFIVTLLSKLVLRRLPYNF